MKKYWLCVFCLLLSACGCQPENPEAGKKECLDLVEPYYCNQDQLCCGGCVNNDEINCGACGNRCGQNATCNGNMCVCGVSLVNCGSGYTCCGNECVDILSNSAFCGSCSDACKESNVCVDGKCLLDCPSGLTKCENNGIFQCIDLNTNSNSCGTCGNVCPQGTVCVNGSCTVICPNGQRQCTVNNITKCVDPASDTNNCGACGHVCGPGEVCALGVCSLSCPVGQEKCSGDTGLHCVDVMSNASHCGACGNVCPSGNACVDGVCSLNCPSGQEMCSETNDSLKCTYLANDASHCGACGAACPSVLNEWLHIEASSCSNGACVIKCIDSYEDKDGSYENGCEQSRCGNGVVEEWEECDGFKLNDATCESIMGEGSKGMLRCKSDCSDYDTTSCSAPTTCGNNKIDGAEVCDSYNLNSRTCEDVVGEGSTGKLACDASCTKFDTSGCSAPTTCGNGVLDPGEKCDDTKFGANVNCSSVVGKGSKGSVKCSSNCAEYVISGCSAPAVCGNNTIEEGEECDGSALGSETCTSLIGGGSTGKLTCTGDCRYSTKGCSAASTCGNNKIDGNDVCDGYALNGMTCADVVGKGSSGTLRCADNCKSYDVSGCTAPSSCGDGFIQANEVCDGLKLNDQSCSTLIGEGSSGILKCNETCTGFITTGCSGISNCGNGRIDEGEVCDGTKLNGATCDSLVGEGSTGVVLCGDDCTYYNLSGCSAATHCGNGVIDEGELCEVDNLNHSSCESIVGTGSTGMLVCGDGCKHFDVSGCTASQFCGDGSINENEICDGDNIGAANCVAVVGFGSSGKLKCNATCTGFDVSGCSAAVTCGNGKLDFDEPCDGNLLNNMTCENLIGPGSTGAPKCNDSCTGFEKGSCTQAITCGNGKLDKSEACDASYAENPFDGKTCEELVGYGSTGNLNCSVDCTSISTQGCSAAVQCGNGIIDEDELCDESYEADPMGGYDCESFVGIGSSGTLQCVNCELVSEQCSPPEGCGNGELNENEACDELLFANNITTCAEFKPSAFGYGDLKCSANCTVDLSNCAALCGNGKVEKGEACDDGNLDSNDGCSSDCSSVEEGWICLKDSNRKSICTTSWCKFLYLDDSDDLLVTGYGRISPAGLTSSDAVLSRMVCGKIGSPASTWTLGSENLGNLNPACSDENGCENNYEYIVSIEKPNINGSYACSFQFTYDAEHWVACSNNGDDDIVLIEENTILENKWLQSFSVTGGDAPEFAVVKKWVFSSNSDVTGDPSITFSDGFTSKLYYSGASAMNVGSWGNADNPDFSSKYIQFSLGNQSSYSEIVLNFDYNSNTNSEGPKKLQVAYFKGDLQVGVSEVLTIDSYGKNLQNSGDLAIPVDAYQNLNIRFSAFDSPKDSGGLLRLANVLIKGK